MNDGNLVPDIDYSELVRQKLTLVKCLPIFALFRLACHFQNEE
jgi:hypothetical protein